jgi:predicted metal-dependent hydrolase
MAGSASGEARAMIVRNMRIDFSGAPMQWAPNKAFSATINAGSPSAAAFEHYLAKVMMRTRDALAGRDAAVAREIDQFIAQEGHHYRLHKAYNKLLFAAYPRAREYEDELATALAERLESRSLAFNLAFSTGFENFACYMAKYQFSKGLARFEGADPRIALLWKWHAAEEYEHRTACNHALTALGSTYALRVSGLIDFLRLMLPWQARLVAYILEVDRATMSEAERAESMRLKKAFDRELMAYILPRMLRIFIPYYDPAPVGAPQALHDALDEYERVALRSAPVRA